MPELLSEDAGTRWMAEERVKMARSFPDVGEGLSSSSNEKKRGRKGKKGKKNKKKGGGGGGGGFA